jgi:Tfp pilus assembly protein PilO
VQVKTKTLIVGGLAVLMVGLLWFRVVYSPIKSKTSKANAAAHDAQTEADNLQKAIDDIMAANKKAAAKDVGTAKMLEAVPAETAEASFLRKLDVVRAVSGANWQSVTPSAPTATGGVTNISVSISVFGNENSLARYLSGLYAMKRVFIPDNVTLTPNGSGGIPGQTATVPDGALFAGGLMQMQVSGRIFAGPAAVESPVTSTGGAAPTGASTGAPTTGSATAPTPAPTH